MRPDFEANVMRPDIEEEIGEAVAECVTSTFKWTFGWIFGKIFAGFCIAAWAVTFMLQMPLMVLTCIYWRKLP